MKKLLIFILIATLLGGMIYWNKSKGSHASLRISSEPVSEQVLADSILASGNLIFNTQIQIRSEVTGIVTQVLVEEGEYVIKGQVLMQLDQTAFSADVANYQAAVNAQKIEIEFVTEQRRELERQLAVKEKLFEQRLIGVDDLERFKSQLNIANIKVKAAKEQLNRHLASLALAQDRRNKTTFRANMPGLISAVDVKPGETVIAGSTNIVGSALMTLADPKTILAELRVDEADIASVKPGMVVDVFAASNPKNALKGKVISIGTSARSARQGLGLFFRVKVLLAPSEQLYPGMSCRAEIITMQSEGSLSVPISAIVSEDDVDFVWLVKKGSAKKQVVSIGMATDTHQQVTKGLTKDDVVVTGPSRTMEKIKDGIALSNKEVK